MAKICRKKIIITTVAKTVILALETKGWTKDWWACHYFVGNL